MFLVGNEKDFYKMLEINILQNVFKELIKILLLIQNFCEIKRFKGLCNLKKVIDNINSK